jgi:alpha-tubulin suppressor-like RCC1 family protein
MVAYHGRKTSSPVEVPMQTRCWRVSRLVVSAIAAALIACHEDTPTAPDEVSDGPGPSLATATAAPAFVQVTQGITHTCGVTPDNLAYCWGDNFFGELGDGTTTGRLLPHAVAGGLRFRVVSAGSHFSCGLTTDDKAYCWGDNSSYALGDGGTESTRLKPVAVVGGRRYRQLRTGGHHVCAVTFGNVVYCWGDNGVGQLGAVTEGLQQSNVPLQVVTGGPVFVRVFPGGAHTCALTSGNVAYCWGDNSVGELGTGSHTSSMTPVRVSGTRTFNQMSAGLNHVCGVSAGKAYCWGANLEGALGDGTLTERTVPTAVAGGLTFKGVSASFDGACGITSTNRAYCWGRNVEGQVGDGTYGYNNRRLVPTKVVGGFTFTTLGGPAGGGHNCAITPDDRAYCWGGNFRGELGIGTTTKRSTRPVPVQ